MFSEHHFFKSGNYRLYPRETSNLSGTVIDLEFNMTHFRPHGSSRLNSKTLVGAIREIDVKMEYRRHLPEVK